jgi:hypothetical protein
MASCGAPGSGTSARGLGSPLHGGARLSGITLRPPGSRPPALRHVIRPASCSSPGRVPHTERQHAASRHHAIRVRPGEPVALFVDYVQKVREPSPWLPVRTNGFGRSHS